MMQVPASSPVKESLVSPFAAQNETPGHIPQVNQTPEKQQFGSVLLVPGSSPVVLDGSPAHPNLIQSRPLAPSYPRTAFVPPQISPYSSETRSPYHPILHHTENSLSPSNGMPITSRHFTDLASRFVHQPGQPPMDPRKRTADEAGYMDSNDRRVRQQTAPMRAIPIAPARPNMSGYAPVPTLTIDHIQDDVEKSKLARLMQIFPAIPLVFLRHELHLMSGNWDAAVNKIASRADRLAATPIHNMSPPGHAYAPRPPQPIVPTATRRHQVSHRSIKDKWASKNHKDSDQDTSSDEDDVEIVGAKGPKVQRRLVQGRRSKKVSLDSDDDDDSDGPEVLDSDDDEVFSVAKKVKSSRELSGKQIESTVFRFLEGATAKQISDLTGQPDDVVQAIIDNRPYQNLDEISAVTIKGQAKNGRGRKTTRKIGERMVEACAEIFSSHNAVDALVASCQYIGRPLTNAVERWGFKVGADELEMVGDEGEKDENQNKKSESKDDEDDSIVLNSRQKPASSRKDAKARADWVEKPAMMADDIVLKDYQVVGLNWLSLLYKHGLSGILADDMGLGKTCQVISFLSHLVEVGANGPHLVIVPGSTLENWLRELERFSPDLRVEPYYGSQVERAEQREMIMRKKGARVNVVVTTYDVAWRPQDCYFLQKIKPTVAVFDEGHTLKNQQSKRHASLMKIPAKSRILLTGTPLQNNLQELVSLLAFLMPNLFQRHSDSLSAIFKYKAKTSDDNHDGLLIDDRTSRARSILAPFILRRKKHQVLKHLPKKTQHVMMCDMDEGQQELYDEVVERQRETILARERGEVNLKASANVMTDLRKAAIHPLLMRNLYEDELLDEMAVVAVREDQFRNSDVELVREDMSVYTDFGLHQLCEEYPTHLGRYSLDPAWLFKSGKIAALRQLLLKFNEAGERALLFSQFTSVMDILERVLAHMEIAFCRLDGSTPISERQDLIDTFTEDDSIKVFMLSTKAGGTGINLIAATKVIIFDLSFNPQEDVQAENRAHRVGQTRDVDVYRLISRGTIEEKIHSLGVTKIALDECVAGAMDAAEAVAKAEEAEMEAVSLVGQMLAEELKKAPPRPRKKEKRADGPKRGVVVELDVDAKDKEKPDESEEKPKKKGRIILRKRVQDDAAEALPTPADSDDGKPAEAGPKRGRPKKGETSVKTTRQAKAADRTGVKSEGKSVVSKGRSKVKAEVKSEERVVLTSSSPPPPPERRKGRSRAGSSSSLSSLSSAGMAAEPMAKAKPKPKAATKKATATKATTAKATATKVKSAATAAAARSENGSQQKAAATKKGSTTIRKGAASGAARSGQKSVADVFSKIPKKRE